MVTVNLFDDESHHMIRLHPVCVGDAGLATQNWALPPKDAQLSQTSAICTQILSGYGYVCVYLSHLKEHYVQTYTCSFRWERY